MLKQFNMAKFVNPNRGHPNTVHRAGGLDTSDCLVASLSPMASELSTFPSMGWARPQVPLEFLSLQGSIPFQYSHRSRLKH